MQPQQIFLCPNFQQKTTVLLHLVTQWLISCQRISVTPPTLTVQDQWGFLFNRSIFAPSGMTVCGTVCFPYLLSYCLFFSVILPQLPVLSCGSDMCAHSCNWVIPFLCPRCFPPFLVHCLQFSIVFIRPEIHTKGVSSRSVAVVWY